MELATTFVLVCACALILWGGLGLVATWFVPALRESRLLGSMMFTGRLKPTRENLALLSLWSVVFGVFLASSVLQYRLLFLVSFVALVPLFFLLMRRRYKSGREV